MALSVLDYVRWDGELGVLAYRFPEPNLGKYTILQVMESQEAIVIVNGEKSQKFGPGNHELNSPNVPILKSFYGFLRGGQNPYTVQIWFVNKLTPMNINWRADSFPIFDVNFGASIPIYSEGTYGVSIKDAERFLLKLSLGFPSGVVTADDFTNQVYGELISKSKSIITKFISTNHIGINDISAHLDDISNYLKSELNHFWNDFGLQMLQFYITNIGVDISTESGRKVQEAIDSQTAQKISGRTWQQEKMFDTANRAIGGISNGDGGLLATLMAAQIMGGMGGIQCAGGLMTPQYNQPICAPNNQKTTNPQQTDSSLKPKEVYCSNCNKKYPSNMKFCPYCGDPYNPCPKCGSDNEPDAKRCVNCGTLLNFHENDICPGCGNPVVQGAAFCPNCGRPLSEQQCPRCGTNIDPSLSFCPNCGYKLKYTS
jgi:membrane protease subunit (stomatin/prohibitin family)